MRQSLPDENLQAVTWLAETNKGNRTRPAAPSGGWVRAHFPEQRLVIEPIPRPALKLIKYQQIISRAVPNFKGLAWLSYDQQFCRQAACDWSLSWDKVDTLSYGQWLLQASLRPTAMFAQVLITLRISVVLLTLTENLATPRLCATTSTTPLAAGTETAATPTPLLFQYPHCHGMHPATAQQWEKGP